MHWVISCFCSLPVLTLRQVQKCWTCQEMERSPELVWSVSMRELCSASCVLGCPPVLPCMSDGCMGWVPLAKSYELLHLLKRKNHAVCTVWGKFFSSHVLKMQFQTMKYFIKSVFLESCFPGIYIHSDFGLQQNRKNSFGRDLGDGCFCSSRIRWKCVTEHVCHRWESSCVFGAARMTDLLGSKLGI